MNSKPHNIKNRDPDTYPFCILCGKGYFGPYAAGGSGWGRRARLDAWSLLCRVPARCNRSLEEAKTLLRKAKCAACGAVKCLELPMRELGSAKDCLVGKALWPNLC